MLSWQALPTTTKSQDLKSLDWQSPTIALMYCAGLHSLDGHYPIISLVKKKSSKSQLKVNYTGIISQKSVIHLTGCHWLLALCSPTYSGRLGTSWLLPIPCHMCQPGMPLPVLAHMSPRWRSQMENISTKTLWQGVPGCWSVNWENAVLWLLWIPTQLPLHWGPPYHPELN